MTSRSVTEEIVRSVKLLCCTMEAVTRTEPELTDTAARLRSSTTRLFRLLRRQSLGGLSPSLLSALATVRREGPLPIGALAEEEAIAPPTATKIVDKLCAGGHVERGTDPTDRRVTLVAVTPEGSRLLDDVGARRTAWLTGVLGDLPPSDYDALLASLDVVERIIADASTATPEAHP